MQEKDIVRRFVAAPLWRKLVAAGIAVVVGSGVFIWARRGAKATPAVLSFDGSVTRGAGPEITDAKSPGLAFARFILSDEAVNGLAKQARISPAEFRSRLEMTQPSSQQLQVRYRDVDNKLSAQTANAVADALVRWMPPITAPTASLPQAPPVLPRPAAAPPRRPMHRSHLQSDVLRGLEAQLTTIDEKLSAQKAVVAAPSSPGADDEQRRALDTQLAAAQKKLADLRVRYTDEYPDVENVKDAIAGIQQKLASLHEATPIAKPPENSANETAALNAERARLVEAIAAEKRRETALQAQAPAREESPSTKPAQPVPTPHTTAQLRGHVQRSPFALVRMAGYSMIRPLGWGAFAGLLGGFLCLFSAVRLERSQIRVTAPEPVARYDAPVREAVTENASIATSVEHHLPDQGEGDDAWEKGIRAALADTDIGREDEVLAIRDEVLAVREEALMHSRSWAQERDEVLRTVHNGIKKNPNSWMAHTEEARSALAKGDFNAAIVEMKNAITKAPEEMKPQLNKIVLQLNKSAGIGI